MARRRRGTRPRDPVMLSTGSEMLRVEVRESSRARRLRVRVGPDIPLEVVVPPGVHDAEIVRSLDRMVGWIADKQRWAERERERPSVLGLERPGVVWVGGEPARVRRARGERAQAKMSHGELWVSGPREKAAGAVERWYRHEARTRIEHACLTENDRLGQVWSAITIRDPRTRWGSCSGRGTLSFSWRLVLAPPEVLRYVVVHELCHLTIPDHSPRFWGAVDEAMPDWREGAEWLREHGRELHAYQPALAVSLEARARGV